MVQAAPSLAQTVLDTKLMANKAEQPNIPVL